MLHEDPLNILIHLLGGRLILTDAVAESFGSDLDSPEKMAKEKGWHRNLVARHFTLTFFSSSGDFADSSSYW